MNTAPKYCIHGKSEILGGKFAPTAHGVFNSWHEANAFAEKNMPTVEFKIEVAR